MKTKFTQSLPLLGTFLALIIGGAVLFKFTPADAVLDASETDVPPTDGAASVTSEVSAEATDAELLADNVNSDPSILQNTTDPDTAESTDDVTNDEVYEETDPRVIMEPTMYETNTSAEVSAKTVHGIYAEANQTVTLGDHYLNDVYVAGNTITVTGTIEGDLFAAGETIVIDGTVMGSVRAAGSSVKVNGAVGRNVMLAAGDIHITERSHVGADVVAYGSDVQILAMVMGNVTGAGEEIFIDSIVEGEINLAGVSELIFGPDAYVMGDVNYTSSKPAQLAEDTTLLGSVNYTEQVVEEKHERKMLIGVFEVVVTILGWLGYLILGIVIIKCCATLSNNVVARMRAKGGASFGYGVLLVIIAPIALIVIAATVIGLPLAAAGLMVYVLALMAAKVFVGLALGKMMFKNSKGLVGPFILGFSLFYLVTQAIGWLGFAGMLVSCIISGLCIVWALGALAAQHKHPHSTNAQ